MPKNKNPQIDHKINIPQTLMDGFTKALTVGIITVQISSIILDVSAYSYRLPANIVAPKAQCRRESKKINLSKGTMR